MGVKSTTKSFNTKINPKIRMHQKICKSKSYTPNKNAVNILYIPQVNLR